MRVPGASRIGGSSEIATEGAACVPSSSVFACPLGGTARPQRWQNLASTASAASHEGQREEGSVNSATILAEPSRARLLAGPSPCENLSMKPKSTMRRALSILWEGPQNALGAVNFAVQLLRRNVDRVDRERGRLFVELRGTGGVSLGYFVFWTRVDSAFVRVNPRNKDHEYGHALQSQLLGPFYLLVVGVPSTLRVMYAMGQWAFTRKPWDGYYDGFPERWADRLGGIVPKERGR